jgi:ubiquitin C-terminal hydrolase
MNNFFKSLSCFDWEDSNDDIDFNIYHTSPINLIFNDNFQEMNIPGLSNFEGNCYLNSILQCFYYCDDLTNYLISNEKEIIKNKGKLSNAYLDLILRLNEKEKYNSAKVFLKILKEVSYNFFKSGGNDPKAVLFYLLENLHNELKEENEDYNEEDICCEDIEREKAFKKCKDNEDKNKSIISELFNWCLLTTNKCNKCGNNHYTCEYKNSMLIELNKYKTKDEYVTLDDLIKYYFEDTIKPFICNTGGEVFKVKFEKKIICLPDYLIIILNRDIIQFNIIYKDNIEFSQYCVNKKYSKYKFIGATLTNDFGKKEGTHAISRCITPKGSYIFNDLQTIKNCLDIDGYNAYILFYKKL